MAYPPIENGGIIGNLRTVALIAVDGTIDWSFLLALLHGEACFLPTDDSGGHDKYVLVTEFLGAPGAHFASVSTLVVTVEDERRVLVGREVLGRVQPGVQQPRVRYVGRLERVAIGIIEDVNVLLSYCLRNLLRRQLHRVFIFRAREQWHEKGDDAYSRAIQIPCAGGA